MEATTPAKESAVDDSMLLEASSTEASSTERRESNSRENEAAHGLAVAVETKWVCEAIKEDHSMPVDDKKVIPPEAMEVLKTCPQTEDAGTQNVEASTSHEAVEACSDTPQYENAEITLVVEMNTDAEMIVQSGVKGEEIMQEEADTSPKHGALFEVVGPVDALQDKEGTGTSPAVTYEHTETHITANILQEAMGKVQTPDQQIERNEPAASDMHVEIETQISGFNKGVRGGLLSEDETKGVERKGEEGHIHAEARIREDAERPCIGENAGTSTGELESKGEGILNEVSGLPDAMEGVGNDEGGRQGEAVAGCTEMVVEAGDTEKEKNILMEVEMEANIGPCANEVSAGIRDGDGEKDGTAGHESAGVEGSNGITEEIVDVNRKEQESGNTTLQMELRTKETSFENEVVQAGYLQNFKARDGVQEGIETVEETIVLSEALKNKEVNKVEEPGRWSNTLQNFKGRDGVHTGIERVEETIVLSEALRNKEVNKVEEPGQWSNTPTGWDANSIVSEKQRMNIKISQHMEGDSGERSNQGMQEMHRETEADTSGIIPPQHHLDAERGPQLGIEEDECHLLLERNNESEKEVGRKVLADHIALHSNKDLNKEVDSGKVELGGQRKEEASGQGLHAFPAIQGILQNSKSKNLAFETSYPTGDRRVQRERQHNRQVHAEMQIRLLPDKSVKADLIKSPEVLEGGSGTRMLKELPFAKSKEAKDEELGTSVGQHWRVGIVMQVKAKTDTSMEERPKDTKMREVGFEHSQGWAFQGMGYENAAHGISRGGRVGMFEEEKTGMSDEANTGTSEEEKYLKAGFEKGDIVEKANQKRKLSDNLALDSGTMNEHCHNDNVVKKAKKKAVNVWAKSSSRKGPKKNSKNGVPQNLSNEDSVLLTPVYVNPDKLEDGPDQPIALSKYDKAEKIELSENRLTASSTKGYRMVRATRGVQEGTWYFEIVVEQLGPTGHTRLGWSTQKGDVQAPVGFDCNSYGYRDLDGSKTHVAIREPYGDLYVEGDVIGFYINLPNGAEYAPKPAPLLSYRGRPYLSDIKEEQPRKVPGSEICFFRNGVCQGTAFRDINAGRYFPAASMYTLPKEPSCIVRFNFGPEFRFPPVDIGDRPAPMAMVSAPYHNALNGKEVGTAAWANVSATGHPSLNNEPQIKIV